MQWMTIFATNDEQMSNWLGVERQPEKDGGFCGLHSLYRSLAGQIITTKPAGWST